MSLIYIAGYNETANGSVCAKCLYTGHAPDETMELFYMGLVSLALTVVNIIAITISGWLTLKLKEVTPQKIPQQFASFWRKDVRLHRDYVNTTKDRDHTILQEAREALGVSKDNDENLEKTFMNTIYNKIQQDGEYISVHSSIQRLYSVPANTMETIEEDGPLSSSHPDKTSRIPVQEIFNRNLYTQGNGLFKMSLQNRRRHNSHTIEPVSFLKRNEEPRSA